MLSIEIIIYNLGIVFGIVITNIDLLVKMKGKPKLYQN